MSDDRDPKKVGYKVTPIHTRWQKGQSGNPKGREKGHKGLKTDLEAALNARNTLKNNITGKEVKGRNQELAIQRLVERAALGDLKAQALLFPMIMQVLGAEDRHTGPRKLSSLDQQILTEVLGSRLREASEAPLAALTDHSEQSADDPDISSNDDPGDEENGDG
jgi:hypothetical protein